MAGFDYAGGSALVNQGQDALQALIQAMQWQTANQGQRGLVPYAPDYSQTSFQSIVEGVKDAEAAGFGQDSDQMVQAIAARSGLPPEIARQVRDAALQYRASTGRDPDESIIMGAVRNASMAAYPSLQKQAQDAMYTGQYGGQDTPAYQAQQVAQSGYLPGTGGASGQPGWYQQTVDWYKQFEGSQGRKPTREEYANAFSGITGLSPDVGAQMFDRGTAYSQSAGGQPVGQAAMEGWLKELAPGQSPVGGPTASFPREQWQQTVQMQQAAAAEQRRQANIQTYGYDPDATGDRSGFGNGGVEQPGSVSRGFPGGVPIPGETPRPWQPGGQSATPPGYTPRYEPTPGEGQMGTFGGPGTPGGSQTAAGQAMQLLAGPQGGQPGSPYTTSGANWTWEARGQAGNPALGPNGQPLSLDAQRFNASKQQWEQQFAQAATEFDRQQLLRDRSQALQEELGRGSLSLDQQRQVAQEQQWLQSFGQAKDEFERQQLLAERKQQTAEEQYQQQFQRAGEQWEAQFSQATTESERNYLLAQRAQSLDEQMRGGQLSLAQQKQATDEKQWIQSFQQAGSQFERQQLLQERQQAAQESQFGQQQQLAEQQYNTSKSQWEAQFSQATTESQRNYLLAQRDQALQEQVQGGQLTLAQRQQAAEEQQWIKSFQQSGSEFERQQLLRERQQQSTESQFAAQQAQQQEQFARTQGFTEQQAAQQYGLQQAGMTGYMGGQQTLGGREQALREQEAARQAEQWRQSELGRIGGQDTLQGRQQALAETTGLAALSGYVGNQATLQRQQQEQQFGLQQGGLTGQYNGQATLPMLQLAASLRGPQDYYQYQQMLGQARGGSTSPDQTARLMSGQGGGFGQWGQTQGATVGGLMGGGQQPQQGAAGQALGLLQRQPLGGPQRVGAPSVQQGQPQPAQPQMTTGRATSATAPYQPGGPQRIGTPGVQSKPADQALGLLRGRPAQPTAQPAGAIQPHQWNAKTVANMSPTDRAMTNSYLESRGVNPEDAWEQARRAAPQGQASTRTTWR